MENKERYILMYINEEFYKYLISQLYRQPNPRFIEKNRLLELINPTKQLEPVIIENQIKYRCCFKVKI